MQNPRGAAAYHYASIDAEILPETVENDIPTLKEYHGKILRCIA